jgi:hypothetical protein
MYHMNPVIALPRRARFIWPRTLTLTLVLWAAQSAWAGQEQLASAIGDTRKEVIATRDRLQTTVDTLDSLVKQKEGSLKPAYDAFAAEVKNTQSDAVVTKARAEKMQTDAQTHFGAWQKEIDTITNAKLRKQGQKRLDSMRKSYDLTISQLREASTSFTPYLSDLTDITKILSNDLTPGGIKAIRGTVSKAKFDIQKVRRYIFDAIKELDSMQKALSSNASK